MEQRKVCGVSDVLSQDTPTKTQEYKKENWHYSDYDEEYMNMQKT
ncbi:hypothetical protein [Bacteroides finegoldii]|nr:hypothetical protein [Bacteroides finegoldii]MDC7138956.1 hypothetical protein [Bacteroides finegoldii]